MKASFEKIDWKDALGIHSKHIKLNRFDSPLHYHPALELTYILKGKGKRFIGNSIEDFKEGDLILVGSNLPHCWQNDRNDLLIEDHEKKNSEAIVIHFSEDIIFRNGLSKFEEIILLAQHGISFNQYKNPELRNKILKFQALDPEEKLIDLLEILQLISKGIDQLEVLNPIKETYSYNQSDLEKINKVYSYIIANFKNEVHLDEVAHLANMTETAFCRYFKKITKRTFIEIVTEFRLDFACDLLRTSNKPVVEICYESGFGNISHFNKIFKKHLFKTPLEYRKSMRTYL